MTRKLDAAHDGASPVLSLRLSPALAAALATEAHRRSTAAGGVPVSPAAVARVLLERALLVGPSSSTPDPAPMVAPSSSTPPDAVPQEAAQSPRRGSTPRSTGRRAEAVAEPPTASTVVADDDQGDEEHKRRRAAQAAMVADDDDQEAADARHAARAAEHTELARIEALRAEISALKMSSRGLADAMTASGFKVSGHAVAEFIGGRTAGLPRWADKFRAWRAAHPPVASSPNLQRPLFTPEEGTP